jgi:hypothetical protein
MVSRARLFLPVFPPVQRSPVPSQLAVGRESRGEAPAPVRPPFSLSLVLSRGNRLRSPIHTRPEIDQDVCGAGRTKEAPTSACPKPGPLYQAGPTATRTMPWKRLECREAQWAGLPSFPSFPASTKTASAQCVRLWSPANCQLPTASMTSEGPSSCCSAGSCTASLEPPAVCFNVNCCLDGQRRVALSSLSTHLPGSAPTLALPIGVGDSLPGQRWQSRASAIL